MELKWKSVPGYSGLYEANNVGDVYSLKNKIIITPQPDPRGYLRVRLWKDGKSRWVRVHRIVAEIFIPNPKEYDQINHKDENKKNNSVNNLEWCTGKYNMNYGTVGERIGQSLGKPVRQYSKDGEFIKEWNSTREAARELGYDHKGISGCCNRIYKTSHNFIWKYV